MHEEKQLQHRIEKIGGLVQQIESIADPSLRASTRELVQLLMEVHGAVLDRALEITAAAGEPGLKIIDALGRDPVVSSVLIIHGLHPDSLETRAQRAIEELQPKFQREGNAIELLQVNAGGEVQVRVTPSKGACASTGNALRTQVEEALYAAAPDMTSLSLEGLDGKAATGFVSLENLMPDGKHTFAAEAPSPAKANPAEQPSAS
jgi:Fe-S cluster biogenesis protein NfuA